MKFGLCCIHNGLQEKQIAFQVMTWKRFSSLPRSEAIKTLSDRYANNLRATRRIIQECGIHGWNYRVSSNILPLMTHPDSGLVWDELPNVSELNRLFRMCGEQAAIGNVRLSCHPDQFNVIASVNEVAVKNTKRELEHHGWFMTKLGCPKTHDSPINIHINGSSGGVAETIKRFSENVLELTDNVTKRLVVEVEDKGDWNAKNLLEEFYSRTSVPVTFDYLHHACNPCGMTQEEAFRGCYETWKVKPLFHYCEGIVGDKNPRKHADMPIGFPETYGFDVDLDVELKGKEQAIEALNSRTVQI